MAPLVRPIALRRPALPLGASGAHLAGCGLGARAVPRALAEDSTPRGWRRTLGSHLPRAAALPGRGVRASRTWRGLRHHPLPRHKQESADADESYPPPRRSEAVATYVP